uniref:glycosyltransferase family 2 protein n=1 Tax=uncultured Erythrobacter sp. TaxID=263913 RepID=UPI0026173FFB|nr:glycosyltransferase family 2 protein [uncultured Erythrobacter sp.]
MDEAAPLEQAEGGRSNSGPLVTFAVFAYNQEKYVREAIEAAFAQTYSPLEIILSDDCSVDGTFAIMQEMAADYTGPHTVTARQSPQNRGLLPHVLDVVRAAQGKYMIVAAGDDISLPQRTDRLVKLFEEEGADFCWSAYEPLDENEGNVRISDENYDRETTIFNLPIRRIHGAVAAYRLSNFDKVPAIDTPIFYEDHFFEIFCEIENLNIGFCPETLVHYRILPDSLSMRLSQNAEVFESRLATRFKRQGETAELAIDSFASPGLLKERPELAKFREYAAFYKAASAWPDMGLSERLKLLQCAPDRRAVKWFLPRAILGWRPFVMLRAVQLKFK